MTLLPYSYRASYSQGIGIYTATWIVGVTCKGLESAHLYIGIIGICTYRYMYAGIAGMGVECKGVCT